MSTSAMRPGAPDRRLGRSHTPDWGDVPRRRGGTEPYDAAALVSFPDAARGIHRCAHLNGNLQTVEPGAYYRSGQMDATTLDITIRRHGSRPS